MSGDYFLDSNVFVYLFDDINEAKRARADTLVEGALRDGGGCISHQVIQEVLNVLTGKLAEPLGNVDARLFLDTTLLPLWRINPHAELYQLALEYRERLRFSFYDSLIVAAAVLGRCDTLYTEDLQHGQVVDGLTIVNPFTKA